MPRRNEQSLNIPLRRPEIEKIDELNNILNGTCYFGSETSITILKSKGPQQARECDLETSSHELLSNGSHQKGCAGIDTQVIFLDFRPKPTLLSQNQLHITSKAFRRLVETLDIPITFVEGLFQHQIWDGSGCFVRRNEKSGRVERIDIFFRAEWGDGKYPQVAMIADFLTGLVTYLIIEAPEAVKKRVKQGISIDRPLAIPALVLDECLNKWINQINIHRAELLSYENPNATAQYRSTRHRDGKDTTEVLHLLCSKTHQMSEHLADFEERCRFLRCAYNTYTDAIKENNKYLDHPWPLNSTNSVDDSLQYLISGADTCRRWASNYNSRTHLYETMLYHLAAHADSQVNEENARTNIGLSIIAMVFLPSTFVSGLFSMAFFVLPSSNNFSVSHWIWMYFAVAIPLTFIVFIIWFFWRRHAKGKRLIHSSHLQHRFGSIASPSFRSR